MKFVQHIYQETETELQTGAGPVFCRMEGSDVTVSFDVAGSPVMEIENPAGLEFPKGYLVTTGVPHCVIPCSSPHQLGSRAQELAGYIANSSFGKGGANLTFADLKSNPVKTITLERGVEEFTQACGTGVIATAKIYNYIFNKTASLQLQSPGGNFKVSFEGLRASLTGPAEIVFKGEL